MQRQYPIQLYSSNVMTFVTIVSFPGFVQSQVLSSQLRGGCVYFPVISHGIFWRVSQSTTSVGSGTHQWMAFSAFSVPLWLAMLEAFPWRLANYLKLVWEFSSRDGLIKLELFWQRGWNCAPRYASLSFSSLLATPLTPLLDATTVQPAPSTIPWHLWEPNKSLPDLTKISSGLTPEKRSLGTQSGMGSKPTAG